MPQAEDKMIESARNISKVLGQLADGKNYHAVFFCEKKIIKLSIANRIYTIPFDKVGLTNMEVPTLFNKFSISNSELLVLYKDEQELLTANIK